MDLAPRKNSASSSPNHLLLADIWMACAPHVEFLLFCSPILLCFRPNQTLLNPMPGSMVPAPYNGVRAKAFTTSTSDITFTTDNKPGMHVRSVLSEDGKVMTTTRQVRSGPAKPGTYTDVWEKE
jgi:hypothetical protein